MKFIDLSLRPSILNHKLLMSVKIIIKNNNFIMGDCVYKLEKNLKNLCNVKYAIACSNGTDGLLLALMSLNIKKNDIVFLPTFTFTSTAESVAFLGAKPFFVDISAKTFNINCIDLENGINLIKNKKKIKAIILVDLFGQPANIDEATIISKKYNIPIIIDAAQSFGAVYKNNNVGSMGMITTTSFFPTKPLGGFGDGGAIFTNNKKIYKKIISLRNHGAGKNKYENVAIGLNSRLDSIQANMLLEKLKFFKKELKMRENLACFYNTHFENIITIPFLNSGVKSAWAQYTIILKHNKNRNDIYSALNKNLIDTKVYYPVPLHKQKIYANYPKTATCLSISEDLAKKVISLPMYPYMKNTIKNKIIFYLLKILKKDGYR